MELNEYRNKAGETAIYPTGEFVIEDIGVLYTALGLAGEAGEIANKVKKVIRDYNGHLTLQDRFALLHELGDVLWYVAMLSKELGMSLDDVAKINLDKLALRRETGTLGGSGDDREVRP